MLIENIALSVDTESYSPFSCKALRSVILACSQESHDSQTALHVCLAKFAWKATAHVDFLRAPCSQVQEGVLDQGEAEDCIASEFNPVRAGFHGGKDIWTQNILNLGIRPDQIIAKVCQLSILAASSYIVLRSDDLRQDLEDWHPYSLSSACAHS